MKLEEIKPNSTFDVFVRVISKGEERSITTKNSRSLRVCEFQVGDETDIVSFSLFNNQIEFLKDEVGNVIEIIRGWAKEFRGKIQLTLGYSGSLERIKDPEFPSLEDIYNQKNRQTEESIENSSKPDVKKQEGVPRTVSEIIPETTFSTIVRVFHPLPAKSYGKVKVKTFMVGDDTGIIPFTTFNDDRDKFKELMGEVVRLKNCWPRLYNGQLEISKGRKGTWKIVPDKKEFISKENLSEQYRKSQLKLIDKLEPAKVYYSEIKGSYYHPSGKTINKKRAKTKLDLVPEPKNQYDPKAVAVYCKGSKVGYIPRNQNAAIFKALTEGGPGIDCTLGVFVPQNSRYTMPSKSYNPLITISTIMEDVEWRPVILYPEDFIVV